MDNIPWLIVLGCDVIEKNLHDKSWQLLENFDLAEIKIHKIFFIRLFLFFLTNFRYCQKFFFIVIIHEFKEVFSLRQPVRILLEFFGLKFKNFGKRKLLRNFL